MESYFIQLVFKKGKIQQNEIGSFHKTCEKTFLLSYPILSRSRGNEDFHISPGTYAA